MMLVHTLEQSTLQSYWKISSEITKMRSQCLAAFDKMSKVGKKEKSFVSKNDRELEKCCLPVI